MNISKKILLGCLLFFCFTPALWARHIKGGEIYYTYLGPGSTPNSEKYLLTLRLFISCASVQGQLETTVNIGVFDNSDGAPSPGSPFTAPLTGDQVIQLSKPSPCILNPSPVCYRIRIYTVTIELPKTPTGWTAVFQRCCRIDDITNLSPNFNIGASYMCSINGTNAIGMNGTNSTPQFLVRDTVLICQHRPFTLNFGATDQEHDSLTYAFTSAYPGGSTDEPIVARPSSQFQIEPLSYRTPFSGEEPLGPQVTIDPNTGVISGIAPAGGDYVVCVLLQEWRNGKVISQKPKDFIIHVDDKCDFAAADLKPSYITCDGLNYSFKNEAPASPLVHSYFWDFGVQGISNDTSNIGTPTYTFPDSGTYKVKLFVNKGEECSDSAQTLMKVYPGFFPGFKSVGTCVLHPIQFFDTTKTKYGLVSNWSWDFGDHTSTSDTSNLQNPSWQYSDTGTKKVTFIVSNSKGCLDTVVQNIQVLDKPPIILPFSDTLICNIDTLQLKANGTGVFSWTPTTNMLLPDTENPLVFPKTTTTYTVTLDQGGCVNTDSILVRVVDHVTLYPGNDSTICLGDTITLNPLGDGLYFLWSPAATLNDPTLKNPLASPTSQTTYHVVASIGKCNTSGIVTISTVPYPGSFAGADTTICYDDTAQLNASMKGIRFVWNPSSSLSNPSVLDPLAFPLTTTTYNLFVYDTLGCPKPGVSSVTVNVNPKINAFAGNDTSIVVGQPLKLSGTGAPFFAWSPSSYLSENDIANPTANPPDNISYIMKAYDQMGCFAYDTINIKVFKTAPDIFVPNAFTPDKNVNRIFRPIPVGISTLVYFRIYNRSGELVFSTSRIGDGWDGTVKGKPQDSGGFVWMAQGVDYTGKVVTKKGTMVLIR